MAPLVELPAKPLAGEICVVRTTAHSGERFATLPALQLRRKRRPPAQDAVVVIDPKITYQTILGFGGSFTESSAKVLQKANPGQQAHIVEAYFDSDVGLGYTMGRVHMNSCDFSKGNWSCCDVPGDAKLKNFSIDRYRMACLCNDGFCATTEGTCLRITTTTTTALGNTHEQVRIMVPQTTMPTSVTAAPVTVARTTPAPIQAKRARPRVRGRRRQRSFATTEAPATTTTAAPGTTTSPAPAAPSCDPYASVGRCLVTGCFVEHGRTANCSRTRCYCKPGLCTVDNRTCIPTPSLSLLAADEDSMPTEDDEDKKEDDDTPQAGEIGYAVFASIAGLSLVLMAVYKASAKRQQRHDGKLTSPLL